MILNYKSYAEYSEIFVEEPCTYEEYVNLMIENLYYDNKNIISITPIPVSHLELQFVVVYSNS